MKFPYYCHHCGKPGYKNVKYHENKLQSDKNSNNTTANTITNSENQICCSFLATSYIKWILDSGETNHMITVIPR